MERIYKLEQLTNILIDESNQDSSNSYWGSYYIHSVVNRTLTQAKKEAGLYWDDPAKNSYTAEQLLACWMKSIGD